MQSVGTLIRHWRKHRRLSQLDLATEAEVSTRHLSCLETGKAKPSREMVLVLASAMEVPLRERNTLLGAAGYAPAYRQTDFGAPEMAGVRTSLEFLLDRTAPYGAVVVDRHWDVLMFNEPVRALSMWMLGSVPEPVNLLRATFDPDGLRPFIANWEDVARDTLDRMHRAALRDPGVNRLIEQLLAYPDVPSDWSRPDWSRTPQLLIPLVLAKDGVELSFFTTVTTLGSAVDVTLAELQIETYFPADEQTDTLMRALVAAA